MQETNTIQPPPPNYPIAQFQEANAQSVPFSWSEKSRAHEIQSLINKFPWLGTLVTGDNFFDRKINAELQPFVFTPETTLNIFIFDENTKSIIEYEIQLKNSSTSLEVTTPEGAPIKDGTLITTKIAPDGKRHITQVVDPFSDSKLWAYLDYYGNNQLYDSMNTSGLNDRIYDFNSEQSFATNPRRHPFYEKIITPHDILGNVDLTKPRNLTIEPDSLGLALRPFNDGTIAFAYYSFQRKTMREGREVYEANIAQSDNVYDSYSTTNPDLLLEAGQEIIGYEQPDGRIAAQLGTKDKDRIWVIFVANGALDDGSIPDPDPTDDLSYYNHMLPYWRQINSLISEIRFIELELGFKEFYEKQENDMPEIYKNLVTRENFFDLSLTQIDDIKINSNYVAARFIPHDNGGIFAQFIEFNYNNMQSPGPGKKFQAFNAGGTPLGVGDSVTAYQTSDGKTIILIYDASGVSSFAEYSNSIVTNQQLAARVANINNFYFTKNKLHTKPEQIKPNKKKDIKNVNYDFIRRANQMKNKTNKRK